MSTTYVVPDQPDDPEDAALNLLVRVPCDLLGYDQLREALQEYAGLLQVTSCFAHMSWPDAKAVAAALAFDAITRDDPSAFMRHRAESVRSGRSGIDWDDPAAVAAAFETAADLLEAHG